MRIPLGISDFRELRQEGFDYIDKTLLIRDLIDEPSKVVLLPRSRRFGKTLNLSMLRYYFERPEEEQGSTESPPARRREGSRYGARPRNHFSRRSITSTAATGTS